MKVFWTDNFNRETMDEREVVRDLSPEQAEKVVAELQRHCTTNDISWYRVARDDEEPYKWEP